MKLQIENVSLSIEGDSILENLNLNVDEHEILSIIGPSASGKSSLLRMIAGLEKIDNGEIFINDIKINELHPSKRQIIHPSKPYKKE